MGNEVSQTGLLTPGHAAHQAQLQPARSDPRLYSTMVYNAGVEGRMMDKPKEENQPRSRANSGANGLRKPNQTSQQHPKDDSVKLALPRSPQNHIKTTSESTETLCMDEVNWKGSHVKTKNRTSDSINSQKDIKTQKTKTERKVPEIKKIPETSRVSSSPVKLKPSESQPDQTPGLNQKPVTTAITSTKASSAFSKRETITPSKEVKQNSTESSKATAETGVKLQQTNNIDSLAPSSSALTKVPKSPPGKLKKNSDNQFQDPRNEMFPAPPGFDELSGLDLSHLSAEERMVILQVAARAKQIEQVEQQKIRSIEDQLAHYSENARQNTTKQSPRHKKREKGERPSRDNQSRNRSSGKTGVKTEKQVKNPSNKTPQPTEASDKTITSKTRGSETQKSEVKLVPEKGKTAPLEISTVEENISKPERLRCYLCSKPIIESDLSVEKGSGEVQQTGGSSLRQGRSTKRPSRTTNQKDNQQENKTKNTISKPSNQDPIKEEELPSVICGSCSQHVCLKCSVKSSLLAKGVLCALCAKQRELVARSNLWLKATKRSQLYRSHSADTPLVGSC